MVIKIIFVLLFVIACYIYFVECPYRNIYMDILIFTPIILIYCHNRGGKKTVKSDPKIIELFKTISVRDIKKFKEIIETKFADIKEVQNCSYYVFLYLFLNYILFVKIYLFKNLFLIGIC